MVLDILSQNTYDKNQETGADDTGVVREWRTILTLELRENSIDGFHLPLPE